MNYFENKVTEIYFADTKEYFCTDVLSSYKNFSYRSCVISLWNVFLYDLERKVTYLNEATDNDKSKDKLQGFIDRFNVIRIEKKLGEELSLIKDITQTGLISSYEYNSCITTLKQERNLCAHPIVENGVLYCTNAYTVRGLIEEILKIIVRKPVYLKLQLNEILSTISNSHSIYNNFVISNLNDIHFNEPEFRLLRHRYYNHFEENQAFKYFETLFSFTFCKNDEESQKNRKANFVELLHFTTKYSKLITKGIHDALNNFVDTKIVKILDDASIIDLFTLFSLRFIDISNTLNQHPQYNDFIKHKATKFDNLKLIEAVILDGEKFKENLQNPHQLFSAENATPFYLLKIIEDYYINLGFKGIAKSINTYAINLYSRPKIHEITHQRFQEYIVPRLKHQKFDFEDIEQLVEEGSKNHFVLTRHMAGRDHGKIASYVKETLKINNPKELEILKNKFFEAYYQDM